MRTLSPRILRSLSPSNYQHRITGIHQRVTQLLRNQHVGSSASDSISRQNRRRAVEYLRQYAREENVSHQEIPTAQEEIFKDAPRGKPSAREKAQARLRKHIPVVTGRVPSPSQLALLLESAHGAHNVVVLDVRHKASFADWLVLCCGVTSNHVLAVADGVVEDMRALEVLIGGEVVTVSGRDSANWMVVDVGSIVVHVMTDEARKLYRLEELWLPEQVPPVDSTHELLR